jgi:hypothetical protein
MNHQEALEFIINRANRLKLTFVNNVKIDEEEQTISEVRNTLQQLIDEKLEQESRKDKLIVGSQWECVANCYYESYGDALKIQKGEVTKITSYHNHTLAITRGIMPTQQFLLCFKPIDKREQLKDVHSDTI